ncbi:TPA: ATP/GTP-binding protein [Vibrio parahaemolyticus]|nr:ATP/GTP-binding protein [Vibrio parahaemolyticus]
MLIYFSAKNFRSIRDEIALDMRPAPRLRRLPHHVNVIKSVSDNETKVLRSAVIYGANASGKSNIVKAIDQMKKLVLGRDRNSDRIETQPFKLDESVNENTDYYIEFIVNRITFGYGMSINKSRVENEYLHCLDPEYEWKVFERQYMPESEDYEVTSDLHMFIQDQENDGNSITEKSYNEFIMLIKYTEDTKLFITESADKKLHNKLKSLATQVFVVHQYFKFSLRVIFPNTYYGGKFHDISQDEISQAYKDLLNKYDTGIDHICTESADINEVSDILKQKAEDALRCGQPYVAHFKGNYYRFSIDEDTDDLVANKIITCRKGKDGKRIDFELNEESDGTSRLFDIIRPLITPYREVDKDATYIIDEFDRSLHPNISKDMIKTFLNNPIEGSNVQLIVTTHESNLLDNDILRRDEIWFVQKEHDLSTQLYSLNEYSTRFDKDIRKAYLDGVYGGVPFIPSMYKKVQ